MAVVTTYVFLVAVRFILTLVPETGYIHPDEFFQSAEIIAGDMFPGNVFVSWEFNNSAPIRNIAIPYFTCGLPFALLKTLSWLFTTLNGFSLITTYWLLVAPRIWMTVLSCMVDYFMWKTCGLLSKDPQVHLCVLASSYVTLTYNIRASSNAIETLLFSVLVYYVVRAIIELSEHQSARSEKCDAKTKGSHTYTIQIAAVLSFGIFNRPTFLIFALAPTALWFQFNHSAAAPNCRSIVRRFVSLLPTVYIVSSCLILVDSVYYSLTVDDIANFNFINSSFKIICTPCNFILYNTNSTNLESHGSHPRWLHLFVNVPLLFGTLGITGFLSYWFSFWFQMIKLQNRWSVIKPISGLLASSYTLPVLLLSLFLHQEPRFLIPILFPLVLAHGSGIWGTKWYSASRLVWLTFNATMLFFYGFLHQGGVITSSSFLTSITEGNNIHVIYFHTYMPPRHLTTIPLHDRVTIHDLGGSDVAELKRVVINLVHNNENIKVLLLSPTTMRNSLTELALRWKFKLINRFPCHLSTEKLPAVEFDWSSFNVRSIFSKLQPQFGLDLYKITEIPILAI